MKRVRHIPLKVAAIVRPHHARTFADEWLTRTLDSGDLWDAFEQTRLIEWPSDTGAGGRETPAERRYNTVEDEILDRMLDVLQPVIEAFSYR